MRAEKSRPLERAARSDETEHHGTGVGRQFATYDLDPVTLAVTLSLLAVNHPLVVAARLGVEVAEERRAYRLAQREAGHDIHGGDSRFWRAFAANHVPYVEMARRRAVPGPLAQREAS